MTPEAIKAAKLIADKLPAFAPPSHINGNPQPGFVEAVTRGYAEKIIAEGLESYRQASQAISDEDKKLDMQFIVMGGRTRYDELKHKGWDYKSFINGWMEGRVKMYQEIRDRLVNS